MATKRPLTLGANGKMQQMQEGDAVAIEAGGTGATDIVDARENLGVNLVWFDRLYETPTDKTYIVVLRVAAGFKVTGITHQSLGGTLSASFMADSSSIAEISVTETKTTTEVDHFQVTAGMEITCVVDDTDSVTDFAFSIVGELYTPIVPDDFEAYAVFVGTQGFDEWEGPTPSPTWWGQATNPYPAAWPENSNPAPVPGATDNPPSTIGTSEFLYGLMTITGFAVMNGDTGEPRLPVISYWNTSSVPCIAYHDGSSWNVVNMTTIATAFSSGCQVFQAGSRVFVSAVNSDSNEVREVTHAGVGSAMSGPGFYYNNFITRDFDGTPILMRQGDTYITSMTLVGDAWVGDGTNRTEDAGGYAPIAACTGTFYSINVYLWKLTRNTDSLWNFTEISEAATTPSGQGYVAAADLPGAEFGDPPIAMAIWTNPNSAYRTRIVYFEADSGTIPISAITYSSPYYPTFVAVDASSRLLAVAVKADESTAPPRIDIYALNGKSTPTLIGSKSFPGHYVPAEHAIYVDAATTSNITLSGEQNIAGFDTAASRILVRSQSAASENGVYVTDSGGWTRATDADEWSDLYRLSVLDFNTFTTYSCTVGASGTVGSTAVTFSVNSSGKPRSAETSDLGPVGIFWTPYVVGAVFDSYRINNILPPA